MEPTHQTLSNIGLLAELSPEELARVEQAATWHHLAEGALVFDVDTDRLDVYFVVSGSVRILGHVPEGEPIPLAEVREGNSFGELAALDGLPRSARVVAASDCVLASVPGDRFLQILQDHPSVGRRMMIRLARIIRSMDTRITNLSALTEQQRIMVELLRLAQPDPKVPEGWYIADLPNHKDIADWAGTSRELVAQVIGELARDNVVKRRNMELVIADWGALQRLARPEQPRDIHARMPEQDDDTSFSQP